jgi:trigger factor
MKIDVSEPTETRRHLSFEVPSDVVTAEIDRVARVYSRSARVPGFRAGKVPAGVIKQRYRDQILYDVAHELIPRLVGDALRDRQLEPVATPDIRDVVLEDGKPLTFIADFETLPPIDPGEYTGLTLSKPPAVLEVGDVDRALERLQRQAARWHPVEDRPAAIGDTLLVDIVRTPKQRMIELPGQAPPPLETIDDLKPEELKSMSVELGASANPPGFDEHLVGTSAKDSRTFTVTYPADYGVEDLRSRTMEFAVTVHGIRRRELLPIDDEFAKEVSDLGTLAELRDRVRHDLQHEAEHEAEHKMRHELLQHLAGRMRTAPEVLIEHEIDRRLEEFVRRLMDQGLDPTKANLDWQDMRQRQRAAAEETVRSTLVLDDIARREGIDTSEADLASEIERFAERSGRTATAVRAGLEKEDGLSRVRAGIRREKTVAWLIEKAHVVQG